VSLNLEISKCMYSMATHYMPYLLIVCSYKSGACLTIRIIIRLVHHKIYVSYIIKYVSSELIHTGLQNKTT